METSPPPTPTPPSFFLPNEKSSLLHFDFLNIIFQLFCNVILRAIKFVHTYCHPKKKIEKIISQKTGTKKQNTTSDIENHKADIAYYQAQRVYQADWQPLVDQWGAPLPLSLLHRVQYRQTRHGDRRWGNEHQFSSYPSNLIEYESEEDYISRQWNRNDLRANWNP